MILPYSERTKFRNAIKRVQVLKSRAEHALRKGLPVPDQIQSITSSEDPQAALRMLEELETRAQEEYLEKLRQAAPNDLTAYAEYVKPEEPPAAHHLFLCENLMAMEAGEILRLLISMPPGHAKSTYSSHHFPSWFIGRHPKKKYIQAGHTQDFCENAFGKVVRAQVDSEEFRNVFGDIRLSGESKAAGFWSIAEHRGSYLTRGVGQGIAGFRANCAGLDDPFSKREDAESPTIRKKVFDWFSADFTTRLLPNSPMFIVATRWHPDDLCGRVEEMSKEGRGLPWTIINLPAIATENDPLGRQVGEALWPDFYDLDYLLNIKSTIPSRDWNSLYMGTPVDEAGGVLKGDWINRYLEPPKNTFDKAGSPIKIEVRRTVLSVDCASKTTERSDYTVITVWVEDLNRQHYLIDVVRKRVEFDDMIRLIEDTARRHGPVSAILVEDKGAGTQYIQTRAAHAPAPVIPISVNNTSKQFRFDGVVPMFSAGQVLLPERAHWLADYESELMSFPAGSHDDQVDSTSQYLAWSRAGARRGTRKLIA